MIDINELLKQLDNSEKIVQDLMKRLSAVESKDEVDDNDNNSELKIKNIKLKHRLQILNTAVQEENKLGEHSKKSEVEVDSSVGDFFVDSSGLLSMIQSDFTASIRRAFPSVDNYGTVIVPSSRPIFGDFQCNSSMVICKLLKSQGIKMSPIEVAKKIHANLTPSDVYDKIEVAPPGYVNIWLSKLFCEKKIKELLTAGVQPPKLKRKKRVLIDFSSPNIAKEMHVGHLRSTIIGDSIARLLEFLGYDVLRINHIGDWGTQFGMLIAHLQDKFPNYINESPPISDLQALYKESKARFDQEPDFKQRAYNCVVSLQKKEPNFIKAWNLICDVSRIEFNKIYSRLDIKIVERGESFYQDLMEDLVEELEKKGVLEEDEGRKVLFSEDKDLIPMTIVKSGGGFTYDTSDLAALKYRIQKDRADWIIIVTDIGQSIHFKLLFSVGEKLDLIDKSKIRMDHVPFGVVLGEDKKKFKTRSGDTVKLTDLLDEGIKRAEETLKQKGRDTVLTEEEMKLAKEAVAYGCIKYADLSHNRINDYVFSFDKMLEDKGNTAVYLLYALTRIRSIIRSANVSDKELASGISTFTLSHEREIKLAKALLQLNDVLLKIVSDLCLHHLCQYLFELSTTFSEFYDSCYCIEKDSNGKIVKIHISRLLLCQATASVMEQIFDILGIKTVSKM